MVKLITLEGIVSSQLVHKGSKSEHEAYVLTLADAYRDKECMSASGRTEKIGDIVLLRYKGNNAFEKPKQLAAAEGNTIEAKGYYLGSGAFIVHSYDIKQ